MQTAASNSFFLTDSSSIKRFADLEATISHGGFYQHLVSELAKAVLDRGALSDLGNRLVVLAEQAHAFRRMNALDQVSRVLLTLPLPRQFQAVGMYYRALHIQRFGCGDVERAVDLFQRVAESAPPRYRMRALVSLAASSRYQSDNQSAMALYRESARFALSNKIYDAYATLGTQKMFAVINGEDGNHRDAVKLLENLFPLAHITRFLQPHLYYDYMNSLAVELCEVGRLEEAKNVSQIVLASPFANAYPEWRETCDEIELKGWRAPRSVLAFSEISASAHVRARNLLRMPLAAHSDSVRRPVRAIAHAPVLDMQAWKNKMTKEDERQRPVTSEEKQARLKELKKLAPREVIIQIMDNIGDERVTNERLLKALIFLEELESLEDEE